MHARSRHLVAALLAALAPLGLLATWLVLRGELPDPLPTHWDLQGRVDGTTSTEALLAGTLALSTAAAATAAWLVARRATPADRAFVVGLTWAAWLVALVFCTSAVLAAGAVEADDVAMSSWAVLAICVAPVLAATANHVLLPTPAPVRAAAPAGDYDGDLRLGAAERVTWVGSSSSTSLLAAAAALEVGAVLAALAFPPVAVPLALVGLALFWVHAVTVRVDASGLTAAWGPLRWPRVRVDLDEVVAAGSEEIRPGAWGGWGYRVTPGATAVVTRQGPGVVVERASGRRFAVTVDGAPEAADLLAALVDRRHRTSGR